MPKLTVQMIAPVREKCGVADYAEYLGVPLRAKVDLMPLVDPANALIELVRADITHIQHQYFLYGGVAPWKNWFSKLVRQLYNSTVLTAHEFVTPAGAPWIRAAIKATNNAQFRSRKLSKVIVHTLLDAQKLRPYRVETSDIVIVRHGVPQTPILPTSDEAKENLGLSNYFVVTLFGFLSRRKGHLFAIKIMKHLPPNFLLIFAGGKHPDDHTTYCDEVEQKISADLGARVRITGYLSSMETLNLMVATDIVIAPFSDSSGSGSLAMAYSCGKPILASDIPPHREYVEETADAVGIVEQFEPEAWAKRISELLLPENREYLALGSRQYAHSHSYEKMAEQTVKVYQNVLEQRL